MKIYLLTFASNNTNYIIARDRLISQANQAAFFDEFIEITESDLPVKHKIFYSENKDFLEDKKTRGYGYWIWKPYLVKYALNQILNDDDILVYIDVGCEICYLAEKRFGQYINTTKKHGGLFFSTGFPEANWTKADLIAHFDIHSLNFNQVQASFFFIKKCEKVCSLVDKWFSITSDKHFIDDSPSIKPNFNGFIEHRHDQSILSLLVHMDNYPIINQNFCFNSSYYYKNSYVFSYPIHAIRNISSHSLLKEFTEKSDVSSIYSTRSIIRYNYNRILQLLKRRLKK